MTNQDKRQIIRWLLDIVAIATLLGVLAGSAAIICYIPFNGALLFAVLYFGALFVDIVIFYIIAQVHFIICQKYNLLTEDEYKKLKETK